jgi:chorismate mutase
MDPDPQHLDAVRGLRGEIDVLDDAIAAAVCERARKVLELRTLKAGLGMAFLDPGREAEILDRAASRVQAPMTAEALREVLACVLAQVKRALPPP